jgi:hypothetical protein
MAYRPGPVVQMEQRNRAEDQQEGQHGPVERLADELARKALLRVQKGDYAPTWTLMDRWVVTAGCPDIRHEMDH